MPIFAPPAAVTAAETTCHKYFTERSSYETLTRVPVRSLVRFAPVTTQDVIGDSMAKNIPLGPAMVTGEWRED